MAERIKAVTAAAAAATAAPASRPVPMKLFATWEVDRTPPNCIPRLCSLTLTRLVILRPLGSDLTSISVAVKMQSSKRTLRSNEMSIPNGGMLDTELELQFALQYPHFLKRDGNKLLILLQRRKRYKNRTMLGYKTLAEGVINMAQVLQKKQMDLELELVSDKAEKYGGHSVALARITVMGLSSQPVDHDKRLMNDPAERLCPEFSDEEEEFSSEAEVEGSDSEPTLDMHRRKTRGKIAVHARQRNLKQKFIALLKRFRVTEELEHEQGEIGQKLSGGDMEIEELFDELEDLSDSGPELDTMSVSSTPKPSLRPFFSSSRSLLAPPSHTAVSSEESGTAPPVAPSAASTAVSQAASSPAQPAAAAASSSSSSATAVAAAAAAAAGPGHPAREKQWCVGCTGTPDRGADRQSDDSSRRADSDSHPENWTDHEANDPPSIVAGSPPKSTEQSNKHENSDRRSRLFARDRGTTSSAGNKSKKHALSVDLRSSAGGGGGGGGGAGDLNTSEPRKALVEQLSRVLPDDSLPDAVSLVSLADPGGAVLAARLQDRNQRVLTTASPADIRATFTCLVGRIQKFCNSSAKPPCPVKIAIAGGDSFVNSVLRNYVELLSFRPPDWQNYLRFLVVPLGSNTLSRYLCSVDARYSALFGEEWREALDREVGMADGAARVSEYLVGANTTLPLSIAEAMVTYRETDDSSQIFIPFINDVRVGCPDSSSSTSVDLEESAIAAAAAAAATAAAAAAATTTSSSSPSVGAQNAGLAGLPAPTTGGGIAPTSMTAAATSTTAAATVAIGATSATAATASTATTTATATATATATSSPTVGSGPSAVTGPTVTGPATGPGSVVPGKLTPPSSPNVGQPATSKTVEGTWEPVELQLDYWTKQSEKTQAEKGKNTLRQAFKALHVQRLPLHGEMPGQTGLIMNFTTKEKKQKIMRLGKKREKERENEPKSQTVDGVTRLICSAKTHNIPLRVSIDGTEWYGVKFFQLSAQWQTHIKTFPVALFDFNPQQGSSTNAG